jgi:hypothetical protein
MILDGGITDTGLSDAVHVCGNSVTPRVGWARRPGA